MVCLFKDGHELEDYLLVKLKNAYFKESLSINKIS
jgi:hypothetical protein